MSATATTTTTAVELEPVSRDAPAWAQATAPTDPDNVVEASRIADASVPDGGYGWVIVASGALLSWWFIGTSYCWGVIQNALVQQGVSSASTLAFVGSVTVACNAVFAAAAAQVLRKLGSRSTGLLGASLLGLGYVFAGFCTHSVAGLFITAGLITGVGISHCYMTVSTITAQYFSKKRGIANGIIYAGGGLGGAVTSLAMERLIEEVGPAWTFRVIGLLTLGTCLPAAWLLKERTSIQSKKFIDWRLAKDYRFVTIFLAGAIGTFPLFVPPFFLPLYSNSLGMSASTGAGLLAGFNFASAFGRIGCGFLSDVVGPLNTLFMSFMLTALSMLALWPESTKVAPLAVFVVINGAANGGFFSTMPTVVGNVFGSARVAVAMAMIVTGWTGGYLLGAPIAGFLLNAYGGEKAGFEAYRPAIFYAGSMALAAAGLTAFVRLRINPHASGKL
ncbi:putative monocarboxylate permease protein [Lasiodiplodia theobromae]|uniref:Monocarboxylate transporter 13 n=2 Tax=Lasiodiplodia TaxID=66739 RepID=A0A5N5D4Q8_9PEZI|nr:Monocarboxylate permease protein [Lasiodiplodia theobromae]KAB2572537.1 Monocarboxylate transporter 13 [Lasiodiplodia theobromae]KAF4536024.1 Monocarboxylate permease protein [Lasiodiplodia theobromae]KAF9633203.1 putative monocarboxylate permease protein [Lasiodiplodia theobromae]KAK0663139.1 Monocarboxylate transporter 13 [Lasiodiplodia hormozganensis]